MDTIARRRLSWTRRTIGARLGRPIEVAAGGLRCALRTPARCLAQQRHDLDVNDPEPQTRIHPMNEAQFWNLVQEAHDAAEGDMDTKCAAIESLVGALSPADATAFGAHFERCMAEAYSWSLWGAAFVIRGGCSDDSFSDFRASLISRGRAQFEAAQGDPESLAEVSLDEDDWVYEGYAYAVWDGVEHAGGERAASLLPDDPSGDPWPEEDVYEMYPALAAKYG
jgi:hypothetical protein